jgi:hypothetical protein
VPGTALCSPSALIYQVEELDDILDVMRAELFQHLLIPHTLMECKHNRSIRDTLDEGTHRLPRALLYGMEVGLLAQPRVGTLEVGRELTAQLSSGGERPLRQVHEP